MIFHTTKFLKYRQKGIWKKDILILISSSGNSANIKQVLNFVKRKIKTIGFTNFNGGYLKKNVIFQFIVKLLIME